MKKMLLEVPTFRLLDAEFGNKIEIVNQPLNGYRATDNFMVHRGMRGMLGDRRSDEWQLTHIPTLRSVCSSAYWRTRKAAVAAAQAIEEGLDWNFNDPGLTKTAMHVLTECICKPLHCFVTDSVLCTQTAKQTKIGRMNQWRAAVERATEASPTSDVPPKGEKNELRVDGST